MISFYAKLECLTLSMDKTGTIKVFEQWLKAINNDESLEFETKYRDRFSNHELLDFMSGIGPGIFKRILDCLDSRSTTNEENVKISKLSETPLYFTNQTLFEYTGDETYEDLRVTFYKDSSKQPEIIKKHRLKLPNIKNSVFPQGFKISLSKEEVIESASKLYSDYLEFITTSGSNMLIREKEQYPYIICLIDENKNEIPVARIDLTKICTWASNTPATTEVTFELELEYIGNRYWEYMTMFKGNSNIDKSRLVQQINKYSFEVAKVYVNEMTFLMKKIQQSEVPMDVNEHNAIFKQFLTVIGQHDGREMYSTHTSEQRDVFPGCQPETLHIRHFSDLIENDYIVLDKSDGERMLMFIYNRSVYLIDRFVHINKTSAVLKIDDLNNCILDGEWIVDHEGKKLYLVFDALFLQKKDIRVESTIARLKYVEKIVDVLSNANNEFSKENKPKVLEANFEIKLKPYVRWNKGVAKSLQALDNRPYETDGRIFMPNTGCPKTRKWSRLFKWKPPHLNTIDLYVEKCEPGKYRLFIHTNLYVHNRELYIVLKNDGKMVWILNENHEVKMISKYAKNIDKGDLEYLDNQSVKIWFPFQTSLITEQELQNHCVYEFYFDYNVKRLKPLQLRYDKSSKGYRGSNHLTVAVDIWDSITNPISSDMLEKLSKLDVKKEDIVNKCLRSQDVSSMFSKEFKAKTVVSKYIRNTTGYENSTSSPIWRIRKFHGFVKNELIKRYCGSIHRVQYIDMLSNAGGKKQKNGSYEMPNTESIINSLNASLGIDRKQLKFSSKDKSKFTIPSNVIEHLRHSMIDNVQSVLDLGFGKGGDLWKYSKSGVQQLVGVENESFLLTGAADCAVKRVTEVKSKKHDITVALLHMDARSNVYDTLKRKNIEMDVDTVSCFFAIHYLFRDEKTLTSFMQNVQEMLSYNGFFIGTFVDGHTLHNSFDTSGVFTTSNSNESKLYEIKRSGESSSVKETSLFGTQIDVFLNDSIIHDYDHLQPHTKKEYLVMFDKFVEFAKHFDLELVESSMFEEFYHSYQGGQLTDDEKKFSFLNRTFVFRKVSNSKYHREHVIARIDDKNNFQFNHSVKMSSNIADELVKLQNIQLATLGVHDDLDKNLLEDDEKLSIQKKNIKKVRPLDEKLVESVVKKKKVTIVKEEITDILGSSEPKKRESDTKTDIEESDTNSKSSKKKIRYYKDTAQNRKLNRVGQPY